MRNVEKENLIAFCQFLKYDAQLLQNLKSMQQEIHSYAFQLSEDTVSTSVAAHSKEPQFYASTINQQSNSSFLYRLAYNEANPRKSQLSHKEFPNFLIRFVDAQSPYSEKGLLLSGFNGESEKICLHKYENFDTSEENSIQTLFQLEEGKGQRIVSLIGKKDKQSLFICSNQQIRAFDVEKGAVTQSGIGTASGMSEGKKSEQSDQITHCTIDPIHDYLTICNEGRLISILDKSLSKQKYCFEACSRSQQKVLSFDYNPNKQYNLMTSHHSMIKFWDIRKTSIPFRVLSQDFHSSLVLNSLYNHSHDELILCSYDDGTVGLYRMLSVASGPTTAIFTEPALTDSLVKLYDEHEDSVYNVCWAQHSPWMFGSVSYGAANLVVNIVPSAEKYRILL